jgi:acyl-CoA thioesterase
MNQVETNELAMACADSMYARDHAAKSMGITIGEVKQGYACVHMKVRKDMLNGHDICHGGYVFALADTAFAYACNSYNKITVAQNCDIDFLRSAKEGEELSAVAEERVRGGKTGLYDVTVSRTNGEVLAYFRGRSYQLNGVLLQQ